MAAPRGKSSARLIDRLIAAPEAFDLFEGARIVEDAAARAAREAGSTPPPEMGGHDRGAGLDDPIRFSAAVTLGFPGSAVHAARLDRSEETSTAAAGGVVRMEVASFGMVGPSGVLPRHYTVLVLERLQRFRDRALRDFLDMFTHRATSILVRAWGKYRVAVQRDRLSGRGKGAAWDDAPRPRDPAAAVLACLIGLGGRTLSGRLRIDESLLLHYSGHLSKQPAAALPLEQLIEDAWGVEADVEQFVGRWLHLEAGDQTRLGGANAILGVDAIAGSRVWSVESAYRVQLGPMSWADFERWLPSGTRLGALSDLLTFHVGPTLEAFVRPVLRAADVPQTQLGGPMGSRLGWTTWLVSRPPPKDADDATFRVML